MIIIDLLYCVKSVAIRRFSGLYFPAFGLNIERYGECLRIQSECGKIRTRKTSNTDTFHAVLFLQIPMKNGFSVLRDQRGKECIR